MVFLFLFLTGIYSLIRSGQMMHLTLLSSYFVLSLLAFVIGRPATGFIVRYVLFLQPLYLACIARGVTFLAEEIGHLWQAYIYKKRSLQSGTYAELRTILWIGLMIVLVLMSLVSVRNGYLQAKINDWRSIAHYLETRILPGDIVAGNRWFKPALSWYFDRGDDVTFLTDDNPKVLEELKNNHRIWYILIGLGKGPVSETLQSILDRIPDEEWEVPELNYMPSFFPVSEFPATLLSGGPGNGSSIHFYDILQPKWTNRSYKHIDVGQAARFQLILSADKPRHLELTYYDHPRKKLDVWIDGQPVATLGGGSDGWKTAQLSVPSLAGESVLVTVKCVGQEACAVSEAALKTK